MKKIEFYKYQGTGNDFIMIDHRNHFFPINETTIKLLCDRRFGIGGDGLILLENDNQEDFKMIYFNSDGNESTMCGNGGRCIVAFAHFLGIFSNQCSFTAIDGLHYASIENEIVKLKMIDVDQITGDGNDCTLNTGSPHYVKFVEDVADYNVYQNGYEIRNSATYKNEGINVNFVEVLGDQKLFVRTYERGVEDETYSCGTGVTASALSFMKDKNINKVQVKVLGGTLNVYAEQQGSQFTNIWLEGPAKQVYKGEILL